MRQDLGHTHLAYVLEGAIIVTIIITIVSSKTQHETGAAVTSELAVVLMLSCAEACTPADDADRKT